MHPVKAAINMINKYAKPADKAKLKGIVAEYGLFDLGSWDNDKWSFRNTMDEDFANFELTGELLKQPKITFSCFWNTRWINNDSVDIVALIRWTGIEISRQMDMALMIWGKFLGREMVSTTLTTHLRSFGSFSPDKKSLFVYLVNKTDMNVNVDLAISNYEIKEIQQKWELTSSEPTDVNPVWKQVKEPDAENDTPKVKATNIKVIEYILN